MRTLICGSLAYDTIMVFRDRFKNHILPDQLHILNVAFLVPDLRREFGGCAGNIAYSLRMLGGEPLIMATVGEDYAPYAQRLEKLALSQRHIRKVANTFTAQAFSQAAVTLMRHLLAGTTCNAQQLDAAARLVADTPGLTGV